MPLHPRRPQPRATSAAARTIAVVGAGMAGIACARTLVQAGHNVTVFESAAVPGGRMATEDSPFGSFDSGAQYFTVRDPRMARAIETTVPGLCRRWSANTVRVLDTQGRVAAAGLPPRDAHWVPAQRMDALLQHWAAPLADAGQLHTATHVQAIARDTLDAQRWQLHTAGADGATGVVAGFDTVLLAVPAAPAAELLRSARQAALAEAAASSEVAPCWSLMLAFPQASQTGLNSLGPQWNAARSTHHRIAWLARESSKPGRGSVERWTVQASEAWSREHFDDAPERVCAKLLRAFSEVTGIRAEPAYAVVRRWRNAKTVKPLGRSHLWDKKASLGACGDWCLGHRVEDAFVSGLELALQVA
jgi:predicted NAD/FAD-dependent oxidoreductase